MHRGAKPFSTSNTHQCGFKIDFKRRREPTEYKTDTVKTGVTVKLYY